MSRSVLVIDDELEVRELVAKVLRRAGYRVSLAGTGEEGLERLDAAPVDCLVVDKVLPGMHGAEVISEARRRWPGLPVVLITAHPEPFSLDGERPEVCLAKPFASLSAVEEAVAAALEARPEAEPLTLRDRLTRALRPRRRT